MLSPENTTNDTTFTRLESTLETYQQIAESDPVKLRNLIPSKEMWRFFISKHHQLQGRKLRDAFVNFDFGCSLNKQNQKNTALSILTLHGNKKVFEYIRDIEGIHSDNTEVLVDSDIYSILEENLWTLTLDQLKTLTIQNLFDLDAGWLPYEINEPGYLENLYQAFDSNFQNPALSLQRLQSLHLLTTRSVKITLYDEHLDENRGEFRKQSCMHSSIRGDTCSREGIKYILSKQFNHGVDYLDFEVAFNECKITINPNTLNFIKNSQNPVNNETLATLFDTSINTFRHNVVANKIKALYYDLKAADDIEDLASSINLLSKSKQYSVWLTSNINNMPSASLKATLLVLIHRYQASIQIAKTPYEKLLAIVSFILDCAHASFFSAANGRTICMNLLNQLLIQNGFPMTILDNQNHFIGYSPAELANDVMDGMENVFQLVEHRDLYGVSTQAISDYLEKNQLTVFLDYFQKITVIEESNRDKYVVKLKEKSTSYFSLSSTFFNSTAQTIHSYISDAKQQVEKRYNSFMH